MIKQQKLTRIERAENSRTTKSLFCFFLPFLYASAVAVAFPSTTEAQSLSGADSALVGRILLAEDRRDSTDASLGEGARHRDTRIRILAQRALGRIKDPRFGNRDSLPPLPAPKAWPEPAWRLRFRALTERRDDCAALRAAAADSALPVRLRAADLARASCASDDSLVATFRSWVDNLPSRDNRAGGHSWHAGAHAFVALARLRPEDARARRSRVATSLIWQVRMYAARAAAVMSDTGMLRALLTDQNPNVVEASIAGLRRVTGHADDERFVVALSSEHAQVVREAAAALDSSAFPGVRETALATWEKWVARRNASERDVRTALLRIAGKTASDDKPPPTQHVLPRDAVALALGKDARLRVTMARQHGGGSFVVKLRGDVAPMMAARVLELALMGYYDGNSWHRVEHDFVVQGGAPGANEYVGFPHFFRDELGTVPHARGTIGMSTRGHDTGDAQWFFNLRDNLRLGRDYTVFAEVVEGIDVVDRILEGDVIESIRQAP